MAEYLSLGIFAFLWVAFTLVRQLVRGYDFNAVPAGKESVTTLKRRRGTYFILRVAVPLVTGIFFFSQAISLWDLNALRPHPVVTKGEFLKHSRSYLTSICETKHDSSPLAWHEISGFRAGNERMGSFSPPSSSNSRHKSPTPPRVMKTFWSLS